MKALAFSLMFALVALAEISYAAPVTADRMTCAQAIATYKKNGRIWVIGNSPNDIVPIYGMKPVSKWRSVHCKSRSSTRRNFWVNTLDDDTCVIAVFCG